MIIFHTSQLIKFQTNQIDQLPEQPVHQIFKRTKLINLQSNQFIKFSNEPN